MVNKIKIELTYKEAIYLMPCITSNGVHFLFFNIEFKILKNNIWITPFIAISWHKNICVYLALYKKCIEFDFKTLKIIIIKA